MIENHDNQPGIKDLLGRLRRAHRRAVARLAAVRLLWVALALAGVLLALDAMFALPDRARQGLAWSVPLLLTAVALVTWWRAMAARSLDRHLARRLERGQSGLENDLINAVEFSDRLARPEPDAGGEVTEGLMRRAIGRAVQEVAPLRDLSPLKPPSLRREGLVLTAGLALAALTLLLFHDVYLAVLPRYLDPRGDHPPYSPTHILVLPAGARVPYGGQQIIRVKTSGVPASEATLVLEDPAGRPLQRLPMFQTDAGQFSQTIENIRDAMRYYIVVPYGRSRRYALDLNKTPRLEQVDLKLTPPPYTHRAVQAHELSAPLVKGYAKSMARLTFRSNRPLSGGELRLEGGQTLSLQPDGQEHNAVSGQFELRQSGKLTAALTDTEGLGSGEIWTGRVEILPDEKPEVTITSPGMDSFAIPTAKTPIVVEANDDLGFSKVTLVRAVNGSIDFAKPLYTGDGSQSFVHAVEELDLADLGASPGDVISYYAMATDSNPEAPQTAATPAFRLAIISFDDYRQMVQSQMTAEDLAKKYEEYKNRLEQMARDQESLQRQTKDLEAKAAQGEPLTKIQQDQLADAQRRQEELARQAQSLGEDMKREAEAPPIFDIEKGFKEDLKDFARRMDQVTSSMQSSGSAMQQASRSPGAGQAAPSLKQSVDAQQQALDALNQNSQAYQQGIEQASKELAQAMKLMGDIEQFKNLYQRQQNMERQARLYKEKTDPTMDDRVRMKELAEEEGAIRQQVEKLGQDLRSHAEEVKADLPKVSADAQKIADELGQRQIAPKMQQSGDKLDQADGPGGHPPAADALAEMEKMISFCQSSGEGAESELRLKISMSKGMSMGQTMAQMRAGMGAGQGRLGAMGQGAGGYYGSASQFAMFGSEQFGKPSRESRIVGPRSRSNAKPGENPAGMSDSATIEELPAAAGEDSKTAVKGGERVMEEYRTLIEAYFRGLADKK